jgi:hypothetical protein
MRARLYATQAFVLCTIIFAVSGCGIFAKPRTPPVRRVLFIGNSYTSYNGGLDKAFEGLDPASETQRVDANGATLQNHWESGNALQAIRKSKWDYVVLQEQSQTPVLATNQFREYAKSFDNAITAAGAKTILLMTWERPDSAKQGVTSVNLSVVFNSVGKSIAVQVAPAGSAFAVSLRSRPDVTLYSQDGHPTDAGTYLAACVLYGTILGSSPVGNPYSGNGLSSDVRTHLQRVAADTLGY